MAVRWPPRPQQHVQLHVGLSPAVPDGAAVLPARRRPRRRLILRLAAVVAAAVVIVCGALIVMAWRAAGREMALPPAHFGWNLQSYPALARIAEPLTIHSRTGVTLLGRVFPGRSGATIVMSHGYGGNQDEMLPAASMLHAEGFTVVTYDERGRGGSGGQSTWGALETKDLRSVIDTVVHHPGVDPAAIGEFGFSIGADMSILEAASDPRIKVVVADGSWPTLQGYLKPRWIDVLRHPNSSWTPLALDMLQLRTGADLGSVRPGAVIARLSPRPILLMDGRDDTDVTPRGSIDNYRLARAPRTLWLIPGETHEGTVQPGGAATWPRMGRFFAAALLRSRR